MLAEIFYWLLNMSILSAFTGVIILILRQIKAIPRRIIGFLWIIPFVRMSVPVALNSPYSLMNLLPEYSIKTVKVYEEISTMNSIQGAKIYHPIVYKTNILENIFSVASVIWLIFAVAFLLTFWILYFTTKKELKNATHFKDNIYISNKVNSPALYGIFKGKIIIPQAIANENLTYIIAHENAHLKRKDNLWRMLAFSLTAIHWFNPLCWLFLKCFLADIELACDEKVISKYTETQKKEYALSLVNSATKTTIFASAFGGAKIKLRVEKILSFKKISLFSLLAFVLLAFCISYILLTNSV